MRPTASPCWPGRSPAGPGPWPISTRAMAEASPRSARAEPVPGIGDRYSPPSQGEESALEIDHRDHDDRRRREDSPAHRPLGLEASGAREDGGARRHDEDEE